MSYIKMEMFYFSLKKKYHQIWQQETLVQNIGFCVCEAVFCQGHG